LALRTKAIVGMKVTGTRWKMGAMTKPMSPMSWYSGSHETPWSVSEFGLQPVDHDGVAFARRFRG
jgi:hypothetical protein